MNIGSAGRLSGLPTKTIRYYEDIGLVRSARRDNGYRDYSDRDVEDLRFIARSRALGFGIEASRRLLKLLRNPDRTSIAVREAATEHLRQIHAKMGELRSMEATLAELVDRCAGDNGPDCPILDSLSGETR